MTSRCYDEELAWGLARSLSLRTLGKGAGWQGGAKWEWRKEKEERECSEKKKLAASGMEELGFQLLANPCILQPAGCSSSLLMCSWYCAAPTQAVDCSQRAEGGSYLGVLFNSLSRHPHVCWKNLGQSWFYSSVNCIKHFRKKSSLLLKISRNEEFLAAAVMSFQQFIYPPASCHKSTLRYPLRLPG